MTGRLRAAGSGGMRGQILPLFAILIVVICGFAALAIDVSGVYSARRTYRSAADAAALAGAQDLFKQGTRTLDERTYLRAQASAFDSLESRFDGTLDASCTPLRTYSPVRTCGLTVDGGATFEVTVQSPIPAGTCQDCDPKRSIGVRLVRTAYPLSFARVLGFDAFRIEIASVGGLDIKKSYTIVTLRPPDSRNNSENEAITFGGTNTAVRVVQGDVGSNGNMVYNGGAAQLQLDPGFDFDYYDPFGVGTRWTTGGATVPAGSILRAPIVEPDYAIPATPPGSATFPADPAPRPANTDDACKATLDALRATSNYGPYLPNDVPDSAVSCWDAGIHTGGPTISGKEVALLMPGLHIFPDGLTVKGGLIGGWDGGEQGVAVVFGRGSTFTNATDTRFPTDIVALNAGDRPLDSTTGTGREATPARYPNIAFYGARRGTPIATPDGKALTVMVQGNGSCQVLDHADCSSSRVMKLTGGAAIYLGGVQYAPEDDASVSGKSGSIGIIGQLWSWTLTYVGNSTIYQGGADKARPGVIRLDAACTTATTPCPGF